MRQNQAFGVFLLALGITIFFLIVQLWSRAKKDPTWILRGEFRDLVGPGGAQLLNAILVTLGAVLGSGSLGLGLVLLRWF